MGTLKRTLDKHAVVAEIDVEGYILKANIMLSEISGYNQDELLGQKYLLLNSEYPPYLSFQALRKIIKFKGIWRGEICNQTRNNEQYCLQATIGRCTEDKADRERYIFIGTDITLPRYNSQHLGLLTSALNAIVEGIVITDRKGNIQWVNPAFTHLTGYAAEEVIGKNPRILKSGKQDPGYYKQLWDTILAGQVWHGELWNRRKDGNIYLEEQSITPVIDERCTTTHFVAIKRDITDHHNLQHKLQQTQKMETIEQMTAGIAQNFNNKLAIIMGFTELALEHIAQLKDTELQHHLEEIYTASGLARDLITQMISFSRSIPGDSQPLQLTPVINQPAGISTPEDTGVLQHQSLNTDSNILVVDDETPLADYLRELLESHDYKVVIENDGNTALSTFKQDPGAFDLVITDQTMPGLTGAELIREIHIIKPDIPTILISGNVENIDANKPADGCNPQAWLTKPFSNKAILNAVEVLLQEKKTDG